MSLCIALHLQLSDKWFRRNLDNVMTDACETTVLHAALPTSLHLSNLPTPRCSITPSPPPSPPYLSPCQFAKLYLVSSEEPDDGTAQRTSRESLRFFRVVQESYLQGNGTHS